MTGTLELTQDILIFRIEQEQISPLFHSSSHQPRRQFRQIRNTRHIGTTNDWFRKRGALPGSNPLCKSYPGSVLLRPLEQHISQFGNTDSYNGIPDNSLMSALFMPYVQQLPFMKKRNLPIRMTINKLPIFQPLDDFIHQGCTCSC